MLAINNALEWKSESRCLWKKVITDSLNGNGTSYDAENLSILQYKCSKCSGFNQKCIVYLRGN